MLVLRSGEGDINFHLKLFAEPVVLEMWVVASQRCHIHFWRKFLSSPEAILRTHSYTTTIVRVNSHLE